MGGFEGDTLASVEANQMLAVAAAACDDKKGEDIRILALDPAESGLSDYFLICTGTNDRQTVAITDEIEIRLKQQFGAYPNAVEGRRQGEWVLMDYVDFIVHVFLPEKRAFYGLERLRPSATTLSVAELNAEIKSAIRAERSSKAASRTAKADETDEQASPGGKAASGRDARRAELPASEAKTTGARGSDVEIDLPKSVASLHKTSVKKSAARKKAPAKAPSPRALAAGVAGVKQRAAAAPSKTSSVKKAAAKKRSRKAD